MHIEPKEFIINMTYQEIWDTIWTFAHHIESVVNNPHYKQFPDSFKNSYSNKVDMFRKICGSCDRVDIYNQTMEKVNQFLIDAKSKVQQ